MKDSVQRTLLIVLVLVGCIGLYYNRLQTYTLVWDDFLVVEQSLNWETTREHLTIPLSTHFCPPFRFLSWFLIDQAGPLDQVPGTLRYGAIAGFVFMLLAVFGFVNALTQCWQRALCSMVLAGMTTVYYPAVGIYTCSQILWSLGFGILAFWTAWSFIGRKNPATLVGSGLLCAFSPAWFATGLVIGPLASLMILIETTTLHWGRRLLYAAVPVLGTTLFVIVALWFAREELFAPQKFGERSPVEAVQPTQATIMVFRGMTEHLCLWSFGIDARFDDRQSWVWLAILVILIGVHVKQATNRGMVVVSLGLAFGGAGIVYAFRSFEGMDFVRSARWYVAYSHIGWVFLLCTISTPRRWETWLFTNRGILILAVAFYCLHSTPARIAGENSHYENQLRGLARLELIEQLCRDHSVGRPDLEAAIGPVRLAGGEAYDGLSLIAYPEKPEQWPPSELRTRIDRVLELGDVEAF